MESPTNLALAFAQFCPKISSLNPENFENLKIFFLCEKILFLLGYSCILGCNNIDMHISNSDPHKWFNYFSTFLISWILIKIQHNYVFFWLLLSTGKKKTSLPLHKPYIIFCYRRYGFVTSGNLVIKLKFWSLVSSYQPTFLYLCPLIIFSTLGLLVTILALFVKNGAYFKV